LGSDADFADIADDLTPMSMLRSVRWPRWRHHLLISLFMLGAVLALARPAAAQTPFGSAGVNRVQVELIPEVSTVRPGESFWTVLRMRIAPEWHTYWLNPGDSGLPTTLEWQLPSGVTAGSVQWPVPGRLPVGPLMNYGFEREVLLPVELSVPADFSQSLLRVDARADWLVCREVCIPESHPVGFELPVAPIAMVADPRHAAVFAAARKALPGRLSDWTIVATVADSVLRIALKPPAGASIPTGEIYFYNGVEGQVAHARPQTVSRHEAGLIVDVPLQNQPITPVDRLSGLLVAAAGFGAGEPSAAVLESPLATAPLPIDALALGPLLERTQFGGTGGSSKAAGVAGASGRLAGGPDIGLLLALGLALAGGLLLNLMPCVFPILSMKALGMVEQAADDPRGLRAHGLAFGAGVLLSFWALAGVLIALRAGGEQIGWGFQLQSPPFVAAMAVLFTLLALNLAGVFEFGSRLAVAAGSLRGRGGHSGSFLNGVLAVAIAAPCTAPFMGAALGYALAQPAGVALAVFAALAIGMALPYMLLSFAPGLARRLPRPGAWMVSFRQAMVFPLLATVAWLAWVLGSQAGNNAVFGLLAGLVLLALAAWIYGRFAIPGASQSARTIATVSTLLLGLAGLYAAWPPTDGAATGSTRAAGAVDWQPWSSERVATLRAEGRPVFIDFTAAWCVTCQANKALVLDSAAVARRMTERNVATLRADWTRPDSAISEALSGYGRSGVPVYVLYLPGRAEPLLLPELLTRDIVLDALDLIVASAVAAQTNDYPNRQTTSSGATP